MSDEHIISRGLFEDSDRVATVGLPMPSNVPLNIRSIVARILCKKHNEGLSLLDAEIKRLRDALVSFRDGKEIGYVTLDGYLVERWLLKVAVGTMASGWLRVKTLPPRGVVRALFGIEPLPSTVALYGVAPVEGLREPFESVTFDTTFGTEGSFATLMTVFGVPLVLSVCMSNPEQRIKEIGAFGKFDVSKSEARRHPVQLLASRRDSDVRLAINFEW